MGRRLLLAALTASLAMACSVAARPSDSPGPPSTAATATAIPNAPATARPTAPMTPPPWPPDDELPANLDPELADAIRLRRSYGLRSDLEYVRAVADDPRASNDAYGVPVYPEEFEDAQRRFAESQDVVPIIQRYAGAHRDEFGGLYIDEASHVGVVSLWTDHLAEHAGAIRKAVGPDARVAFGQVRFAESQLRVLQDRISADWQADWVTEIPAAFQGVGVDIQTSQVTVDISSANPDAVAIIEAHYDLGHQLRVESDDTGVALLPWGTVTGRVRGIADLRAWNLSLNWESRDSGECGGGDMGFGVNDKGQFELPCQIGTWTIIVVDSSSDDSVRELGRGTVEVLADKTVTLDIHLDTGS